MKNRCLEIARILRDQLKAMKKHGAPRQELQMHENFQAVFNAAPHYIVELDPVVSLEEINVQTQRDLHQFFAPPHQSFLLDFPPLENVRDRNFAPFLFCRVIGSHDIYIQNFTIMADIDQELYFQSTFQPSMISPQAHAMPDKLKRNLLKDMIQEYPLGVDSFLISAPNKDWANPVMKWSTLGNDGCEFNQPDDQSVLWLAQNDYPRFMFHVCPYLRDSKELGCQGKFNAHCKEAIEVDQAIWFLMYYAVTYINYPAHYVVEEAEQMTDKEKQQFAKQKKESAINPKKPRYRVIYYKDLVKIKKGGKGGTHASPTPYKTKGYWMNFRHPRYVNMRWQEVWVEGRKVGDLEWQSGHMHYRVVEPPSRKYEK